LIIAQLREGVILRDLRANGQFTPPRILRQYYGNITEYYGNITALFLQWMGKKEL
jgi:hypothetical protein